MFGGGSGRGVGGGGGRDNKIKLFTVCIDVLYFAFTGWNGAHFIFCINLIIQYSFQ